MFRSIRKYGLCFILGAVGYAAIEMLWRGRTHWSMMIAGGLCFMMFSMVAKTMNRHNIFAKAIVCALGVTAIELVFGIIFNVWLGMRVWDYSNQPFNILGQICPLFTLMWTGIAIVFLPLADAINKRYA